MSINLCRAFPDANTLNLGGGYKVARMSYEKARIHAASRARHPLQALMPRAFATLSGHRAGCCGRARARRLRGVRQRDGPQGAPATALAAPRCWRGADAGCRATTQLHLEIEPGTFLLANSCAIVSVIQARVRRSALRARAHPCQALTPRALLSFAGHCDDVHAHVPEAGRGHDGSAAPLAVRRATPRVRRPRTQQLTRATSRPGAGTARSTRSWS